LLLLLEAALHFWSILEGHGAVEETVAEEFSLTCLSLGLVFIQGLDRVFCCLEVGNQVRQVPSLETLRVVHVDSDSLYGRKIAQVSELGKSCRKSPLCAIKQLRIGQFRVRFTHDGGCRPRAHQLLSERVVPLLWERLYCVRHRAPCLPSDIGDSNVIIWCGFDAI